MTFQKTVIFTLKLYILKSCITKHYCLHVPATHTNIFREYFFHITDSLYVSALIYHIQVTTFHTLLCTKLHNDRMVNLSIYIYIYPACDVDNSPPSSAEVKNMWRCALPLLSIYASMAWKGTAVIYIYIHTYINIKFTLEQAIKA